VYKNLYRNSGREQGTLRYYREKLQRRNVSQDVKHYEECDQLFTSVGCSYTVAAFLEFFEMDTTEDKPGCNMPPCYVVSGHGDKEAYFNHVMDKFVEEYLLPTTNDNELMSDEQTDLVKEYSLCLLRYYFLFIDIKDAVREGDGERIATLHKELLHHFKSDSGYNAYAIEMLTSIVQIEVFLSEKEACKCKWASTANWKGGVGNNIEADLLQENVNRDFKKAIKGMGANKTDKAIARMSRAAGGLREIVLNFDNKTGIKVKPSSHSHKSSKNDEQQIITDLINLKPFSSIEGRRHDAFPDASSNTLAALDKDAFHEWLKRHQKNLLMHAPVEDDVNNDDDLE
jgi:hypothetical protein